MVRIVGLSGNVEGLIGGQAELGLQLLDVISLQSYIVVRQTVLMA